MFLPEAKASEADTPTNYHGKPQQANSSDDMTENREAVLLVTPYEESSKQKRSMAHESLTIRPSSYQAIMPSYRDLGFNSN